MSQNRLLGTLRMTLLIFLLAAALFLLGYSSCKTGGFAAGIAEIILSRSFLITGPQDGEGQDLDWVVTTPYAAGSTITEENMGSGVSEYDAGSAFKGYNLYASTETGTAMLVNMEGDVVYEWENPGTKSIHDMSMDDNGDLYVVECYKHLVRLDKDSNEIWTYNEPCHHDVFLGPDGLVYVLVRYKENVSWINYGKDVYVDYIHVLDRDGRFVKSIPFIDMLEESMLSYLIPTINIYEPDIFHANSIFVFDGSLESLDPALYKKGNILFSLRNINLIGIYDPDSDRLLWAWGPGNIYRQHNATLLDNGNVLLFDNGVAVSRVVEINPRYNRAEWSYGGKTSEFFFSFSMGSAQRLQNGNTLIGVSNKGYAFEVTPDGRTVWKYVNPHLLEDSDSVLRGTFYRMTRIAPDKLNPLKDGTGRR